MKNIYKQFYSITPPRPRFCIVCLLFFASTFCGDDMSVETYRVPRKSRNTAAHSARGGLRWTAPAGWRERSPSLMRLASYRVPGPTNDPADDADAAIVVLGGDGGGLAANVNRWRNQIDLPPLAPGAVLRTARTLRGAAGAFRWFAIKNPELPGKAVWAAVLSTGRSTVFVKMTGPVRTLEKNQGKFLSLCKSIRSL